MTQLTTLDRLAPTETLINDLNHTSSTIKDFVEPFWKKDNFTVQVKCENGSTLDPQDMCTCAGVRDNTTPTSVIDQSWISSDPTHLRDIMTFTRTFRDE